MTQACAKSLSLKRQCILCSGLRSSWQYQLWVAVGTPKCKSKHDIAYLPAGRAIRTTERRAIGTQAGPYALRQGHSTPGRATCTFRQGHSAPGRATCTQAGPDALQAGHAAVPPGPAAMLGGGLAPAVDWGTELGRGLAGAGLLVAVAPTVAKGGLGLLADVSTFSGSRGLRTAACRHTAFNVSDYDNGQS